MSAKILWVDFKPDMKAPRPSSHREHPVVCYHNFSNKRGHDHWSRGKGAKRRKSGRNEITMEGQNQTWRARSASRSCQFCGTQSRCRRQGMSKRSCRGGERRWKDVWTIHSVTNTCGSFDICKAKQKLFNWIKCDKAQIHNSKFRTRTREVWVQ